MSQPSQTSSEPGSANASEPARPSTRPPYSAPAITWVEPYEPLSFGVSCVKQPGNPPCNTGPVAA